jgi:hypothetical protein
LDIVCVPHVEEQKISFDLLLQLTRTQVQALCMAVDATTEVDLDQDENKPRLPEKLLSLISAKPLPYIPYEALEELVEDEGYHAKILSMPNNKRHPLNSLFRFLPMLVVGIRKY